MKDGYVTVDLNLELRHNVIARLFEKDNFFLKKKTYLKYGKL